MRTPTNSADYEAQYENIIHWLTKAGAPSDVLGYVEHLYKISETFDRMLCALEEGAKRVDIYLKCLDKQKDHI
jgi:hypothetical protein